MYTLHNNEFYNCLSLASAFISNSVAL